jgi:NAD(P)H-flavin reductase
MFPINLSITRIIKHTPTTWSFFMVPQQAVRPSFIAGQIAVLEMNNYGDSHYAFASAPEENEFEFLIKRRASVNVTAALFDPHIAKRIVLKDIIGHGFTVEQHKGHDLVFVAMGTGLAPLRSALHHIFRQRDEYGRLFVLYGARTIDDFCYEEEMTSDWHRQGVELRQVISQSGDAAWDGPTGYVQSLLDNVVPDMNNPLALVCGSLEMIEQTRKRLGELGFTPEKILTNY